ncbi:23S rRNA (cytidine(2498)-2'-O)-methyltransferase RlmM [Chitiniphilus purpureus]|uniref:23S rRNA (Cytidine(2498)-2'-O)-methyltransferase RlmM n=1 Tax=Chitiniphilus purpureus TaxID=2981137 RepID=A0ABY6DII3_9NEIS|nr:23S rRNA (cytidine(2498)-2'-O)-methyltransferase RlmM [Chitiniphilus sp. CD1]UXY14164.1 23S rRNA (cytidine(2498)-2'-O)-methyltransferase RlmM [Chitiniphilus sp. CD1]
MTPATAVLFYCRSGFENDLYQEWQARSGLQARWESAAGYALAFLQEEPEPTLLHTDSWIFARQALRGMALVELGERDRLSPILDAIAALPAHWRGPWSAVWLEHPDSDEGKPLSGFCHRFTPLLEQALRERGMLDPTRDGPRLHLFFTGLNRVWLACSDPAHASPWPLGIARVRMPAEAPSRSTLKLSEALMTLVPDAHDCLKPGMVGVDLGAAPGGWTFQLVTRGLKVFAIDNGPLKGTMALHPYVKHLREDGFRYRPRHPVDWLVCDMVEQPARVAKLIADWFVRGDTRHAVFNLKLPMKKRWPEIERCFALIESALDEAGLRYTLAAKQLYHDREEITCYLALRRSAERTRRRRQVPDRV